MGITVHAMPAGQEAFVQSISMNAHLILAFMEGPVL